MQVSVFYGKSLACGICGLIATSVLLASATAALALVPAGGGGPGPDPNPPKAGPGIPYISGRLAGPQSAAVSPPAGAVVPDEFCIPGKLNDCGDHLRDQQANSAFEEPETVFFGDPNLAFSEARNSGWFDAQIRTTDLNATGESRTLHTFSIGGDRRIGENFLLGVMTASTNSTTNFSASGISDSGQGVLVGPYFGFRLGESWALDGRYIFGNVDHSVDTTGVFTGQYQSRETFAALRISGLLDRENWRFHPSLEFSATARDDNAYIDGVRGPVAAASTSENFLTGAVLAYYKGLSIADGGLMPYGGLEVSQQLGNGGPFAALRLGVSNVFGNGAIASLDYAYGAIGLANVDDQMVTVRFEIPF